MQSIKEKLNDMSALRKAKAEAREEEKEEKEIAKSRVEVAHEVRMAREAEAAMDLHVNKAAEKAAKHDRKHPHHRHDIDGGEENSYGMNPNNSPTSNYYSTDSTYASAESAVHGGRGTSSIGSAAAAGTRDAGNMSGGPPTNNKLL
ncbi:hypothetical protein BUALT_Bualt19G0030100 [Buddleja alternifolia]|uniref:Uncharacterized protein n=1 Tax=Buddleja alternifolia TaxID=168488 RepID=A0AAV6W1V1_9LAMI|nr:hypothetical protein BUALT_Bualt19G0030100 [Buddleja alternifolia]